MKTKLHTRRIKRDEKTRPRRRRREAREDSETIERRRVEPERRTRVRRRIEDRRTGRQVADPDGPTLRKLAGSVIASLLDFRARTREERPAYQHLRSELVDLLSDFQRRSKRYGLDEYGHAHFALVALADESAMSVEWDGERKWEENPLQVELFGKFDAGDRFFARLKEAQDDDDPGVLEVFFNCLCAGFQGVHRNDPSALRSLRGRLMQRLEVLDLRDENFLTPDAYGRDLERPLLTRRFPIAWALPIVLGAVGLYVGYYVMLDRQARDIVDSARTSANEEVHSAAPR